MCVCVCVCVCVCLFTNPSTQIECDIRTNFKWSLTDLNSVFLLLDQLLSKC